MPSPCTSKHLTEEQFFRIFIRFISHSLQLMCLISKLVTFCPFYLNKMRSLILHITDDLWDECSHHTDPLCICHDRGWKGSHNPEAKSCHFDQMIQQNLQILLSVLHECKVFQILFSNWNGKSHICQIDLTYHGFEGLLICSKYSTCLAYQLQLGLLRGYAFSELVMLMKSLTPKSIWFLQELDQCTK